MANTIANVFLNFMMHSSPGASAYLEPRFYTKNRPSTNKQDSVVGSFEGRYRNSCQYSWPFSSRIPGAKETLNTRSAPYGLRQLDD